MIFYVAELVSFIIIIIINVVPYLFRYLIFGSCHWTCTAEKTEVSKK